MSSIREQEKNLFEKWIKHDEWIHQEYWTGINRPVKDVFIPDGLHFTGKPSEPICGEGNIWREMEPDNQEEEIWKNAFFKPVFLCKDCNGSSDDLRYETGYANEKFYGTFYFNYLTLLYGLTNYNPAINEFPTREEACNMNNFWKGDKGFFHAPVVRMNLKKIAGTSSCPDYILRRYIDKDRDLITEQKNIYQGANVFICCCGAQANSNSIWRLLTSREDGWFSDLLHYDKDPLQSIWYSKEHRVIVIWAYHMSCPGEDYYRYIQYLRLFLSEPENKGFLD